MRILTFSSLYPNSVDPTHGVFVERRLRRLAEGTDVSPSVVAPVPWFPIRSRIFGRYGRFAAVPRFERRHGIDVHHPRFPVVPKVGMSFVPRWMAYSCRDTVSGALNVASGDHFLIDAHYFFPDGVAASLLSEQLGIPFIVTARGSDINLIATMDGPRPMILQAANKARAVISVSRALARQMELLGVPGEKIHVLRNGVDTELFQPGNRESARRQLQLDGTVLLSVGALKEAKGHDVAIRSLMLIPDSKLVIIGSGEYEKELRKLVARCGLQGRVSFTGTLDEKQLLNYYQAADALLLISRREGMPNVVLESLACGTPVIASDVGGVSEIVDSSTLGYLLQDREPESVANAWAKLTQNGVDRDAIRALAKSFSWDETIDRLYQVIQECSGTSAH